MKCIRASNLFQYDRKNPKLEYRGIYINSMLWRPIEPYAIMNNGILNSQNLFLMIGHLSGILMALGGAEYGRIHTFLSTLRQNTGEKPIQNRMNTFYTTYLRVDIREMEEEFASKVKYIQIYSYPESGKSANVFKLNFNDCGNNQNDGISGDGIHKELTFQFKNITPDLL